MMVHIANRHAGPVPASTEIREGAQVGRWTPEQVRGDVVEMARGRADQVRREMAGHLSDALPNDVDVTIEGDRIVLKGRGIARRWLRDPALAMLRDVAGWARAGWFR
jgi:hypothetical protein